MSYKIDEFYTTGRRDCTALVEAVIYDNGRITATADEDKITQRQLEQALAEKYPGYSFTVTACGRAGDGYYIVDGVEV